MSSKERVLQRERERGRMAAQAVQEASVTMTGTELNAADDRIPRFTEAVKHKNMLTRKAGQEDGLPSFGSYGGTTPPSRSPSVPTPPATTTPETAASTEPDGQSAARSMSTPSIPMSARSSGRM